MSYGKLDYDPLADAHRCEFCNRWYRSLSTHITRHHKMTTNEYKKKFGINMNEQLMGISVLEKLRKVAIENNLERNLINGIQHRFKKGENKIQSYERSEQTKKRLRTLRLGKRKSKYVKKVII